MNFIIATDSSCDLPLSYVESHQIPIFHITATLEDTEIKDDLGLSYSHNAFYTALRNGAMPITAQVNVYAFKEMFTKWARSGAPVLYIAFSSGLSGTYNSAIIARNEVLEEYPDANITVIDSLCASGGVGLLVYKACEMRKSGSSLEEVITMVNTYKEQIFHIFTVDDLHHLERGGRVSQLSAFVGTLLKIKPILYVNTEGKLIPCHKVRGRKKSLHSLAEYYNKLCTDKAHTVFITHGDSLEDATLLANELKETYSVKDIVMNNIGPAIGAHSGPDTIALFFIAKDKSTLC